VLRPPGRFVAFAFGAALVAHVALAARGLHAHAWRPGDLAQNLVWLALSVVVFGIGRLFLADLPPGPTGAHDARGLGETWAASLALGWLGFTAGLVPMARLRVALAEAGSPTARWLPYALAAALLALLALARWLTLPGAMVPRHAVERPGASAAHRIALVVVLAWLGHALATRAFVPALAWVALAVLLERALATARRAAGGRALFLCFAATLASPGGGGQGNTYGLVDELGVAVALGAGAAYLVPWLRRADRRACALAALFLAAPLLRGWDPLALAGPVVLVAASHRAQRRFALAAAAAACVAFALLGLWRVLPGRERLLIAPELARIAFDTRLWGLAWPAVLAAGALGALGALSALACDRRAAREPWSPGTIDPPRREALAVLALVVRAGAARALPVSPWSE
jgi:hypothetical protein